MRKNHDWGRRLGPGSERQLANGGNRVDFCSYSNAETSSTSVRSPFVGSNTRTAVVTRHERE